MKTKEKKPTKAAKVKPVKPKLPAMAKHRLLLCKLQALAERGINGERTAAQAKLDRLLAKYDFAVPSVDLQDIFGGQFVPASTAVKVAEIVEMDIANAVKWSFENQAGIRCAFQGNNLMAQADHCTAARMASIAGTVAQAFRSLWSTYNRAGAELSDRPNFMLGLYDGMTGEIRAGLLPTRVVKRLGKAKRGTVTRAPGLSIHPYTVAVGLGKSIRFEIPLSEITAQLEQKLTAQLNSSQ